MSDSIFSARRDELEVIAGRIAELAPDRRDEVAAALDHIRANRFEIGVIGQIKAGKSTFLNAITERPGLLPVDVNPWTAVITRMCFGEGKEAAGSARFRFFSREEWAQIAERQTVVDRVRLKLKELGEADADAREEARLEGERRKIAERTQRRLGSELPRLLGTERRFDKVDRSVLEQFLASGELVDPTRPDAGKYSDVTREAELAFDLPPFHEACTIVDTPGTNDPFKARSAVTMRYLATADAYLLLLHGPQALAAQDVELINALLRGLHKERLVVFINRIDNFNDIPSDTAKVVKRVRDWFKEHFPSLEIPVLTGCAFWAERAMRLDAKAARAFLFKEGACEYGIAHGFFTREQFAAWEAQPEAHLEDIRRAMVSASGLPAARQAVTETLLREKGLALLDGGRRNLLARAESYAAESALKAEALEKDAVVLEGDAKTAQHELQRLELEISQMGESKERLEKTKTTGESELKEEVESALESLAHALDAAIEDAARAEGQRLRNNGIGVFDDSSWTANVARIRELVERAFLRQCPMASRKVHDAQQRLRTSLRRGLAEVADLGTVEIDATLAAPIDPSPSLEALGTECTIEMGGFFDRLFAGSGDAEAKASELEQAVIDSFEPALTGLMESARAALEEAADSTISTCSQAVERALQRIEADVSGRRATYEARAKEKDPDASRKQAAEARRQAKAQREQGAKLAAVGQELRALNYGAAARAA